MQIHDIDSVNTEIFSILWEGSLTQLENRDGLLAATIKRKVVIGQLSDEEKLELETTVGKMERVFLEAFGCGDFMRCMPLCEERVVSYLLPTERSAKTDELNFEHHVRLMLFALYGKKEKILLTSGQIKKVTVVANGILSGSPQPLPLREATYKVTKTYEAFLLLKEEISQRKGECHLVWNKEWFSSISLSSSCAFCNPKVIQKQDVLETPFNHIISNSKPYTEPEHHLMIIPKRHITTISASSPEEILDKYSCFSKMCSIVNNYFVCPEVVVVTKIGRKSGQTQSHLHDHVIAFSSDTLQPWMTNWAYEFCQEPNPSPALDESQLRMVQNKWSQLFMENSEVKP
ncbi:HIT domain-containing protein [Parachlamydia acanthamoebae]|uniref:HIT domain-containing protein n=1 Tax=Parachlamydia acanthamoebae TaxID=83552 RepID=A0A0C1EJR4_9BACT|nr:HIT domain-containing protein [Parachlamydia acanthamoebae]KIA76784.1 hypothetical protein DB43_HK00570 [Parachlamydia acanthamoebae]